jgi:carbonic anhydrase
MALTSSSIINRRSAIRQLSSLGVLTALSSVLHLQSAGAENDQAQKGPCNAKRPTTPTAALEALMRGNAHWAAQTQVHPGEDSQRRMCAATNGQTPFAAIISCSDSRVPPELLFDQGLGDLFVARVAGNGATGTLTESLYYGFAPVGVLVLFVLGHSDCGAVKAAVTSFPKHDLEFVRLIFPAVERARQIVGPPYDAKKVTPVATDQNVILTVNALRKNSLFKQAVDAGTLLIAGGRYDLDTQQVNVLIK